MGGAAEQVQLETGEPAAQRKVGAAASCITVRIAGPGGAAERRELRRAGDAHLRPRRRDIGIGGTKVAVARERLFRSEEHTSELQSLMRISYAVFCLKKKQSPTDNTAAPTRKHHSTR